MASSNLPSSWHSSPGDSFHGKITPAGPFKPEKDRYHLYIGLFCPFAHRANIIVHLKQLHKYAGIETSIVKPYPKEDHESRPDGLDESHYEGATEEKLFGFQFMNQVYFKADENYKGKYSVPVLWDKKLDTIVNNESHELLRDLQHCFDTLLPPELHEIDLFPSNMQSKILALEEPLQRDLNTGVYKAGFAPDQATYEKNLPPVFGILNYLEALTAANGGPYILGDTLTEVDIRVFCTLIRFDVVYFQHFKCNLGMIRYSYPHLDNWLRRIYWEHEAFRETTDFRHIKENYTKSHKGVNPKGVTPVGPWPNIQKGFEQDLSKLEVGKVDMPEVVECEERLKKEVRL
ncbi:Glutathione S-transferase omega-like 2 [Fulvia fulva]|nr:Glutathione S-transferase omega-like 2 [Fulvia fulva]WPV15172.1 Glutathione S-transferase omega-like 2 [Fulvia fulva]WPV29922.1 Glutathione S-transferase omega-like 2 [Fulvia fulva]